MVGGTVIGVSCSGSEALLNVQDNHGTECAVRCGTKRADTGEEIVIHPGDEVWWQCGFVYWTPRGSCSVLCRNRDNDEETKGSDIRLEKIGYSH